MNIQELPNDILSYHIIFSHFEVYKVFFLLNKKFNELCSNDRESISYFLDKINEGGKIYYVHKDTGLIEGVYKEYDENGHIIKVVDSYRNGLSKGKIYTYYPTGNLKSESEVYNGMLYGKSMEWYQNGVKKEEKTYRAGMQFGDIIEWHPNGNIMYHYFTNHNDDMVTIKSYYEDGAPKYVIVYRNDVIYINKEWDVEGNEIIKSTCIIL